jgi:cysteine desulfurase
MMAALDVCGNPSSVHAEGRAARRLVEEARAAVAALVGAEARHVIFTSGGTEANALALSPRPGRDRGALPCDRLLVSAVEHPSVLAGGRFAAQAIERLPVTANGQIDLAVLRDRLARHADEGKRTLVSIMQANNETGIVQPVREAADLVHAAGGFLHVDAIQATGKIQCDINVLGADLLTLSGHKLGAPKGVGALVNRTEVNEVDPLIRGGGQERGARAGTENVAGIAGFGAAADAARAGLAAEAAHMHKMRERLEAGLRSATPAAIIFGAETERLPNTTLVALPGLKAETAIIAFDLDGIALSSGAACSSGKVQPSHVLAAMGVAPDLAKGAIRVSVGPTTTESEVDWFLDGWIRLALALAKGRTGIAA